MKLLHSVEKGWTFKTKYIFIHACYCNHYIKILTK